MTPTSISGYSAFGQTLVRSNGLCRCVFARASVITWMKSVQRGKSPASLYRLVEDGLLATPQTQISPAWRSGTIAGRPQRLDGDAAIGGKGRQTRRSGRP